MGLINVTDSLDKFWANYPHLPSEHEKKSLIDWALSLNDQEALDWALDWNNHPRPSTGSIPKPNLATLKLLSSEFRIQRRVDENQRLDSLATEEGCFYCDNYGMIYDVDRRRVYWRPAVIGRCKHCKVGEKGSGWLTPAEPSADVIEFARSNHVDCVWAVDMMIALHEQELKEKPNMHNEVPF